MVLVCGYICVWMVLVEVNVVTVDVVILYIYFNTHY